LKHADMAVRAPIAKYLNQPWCVTYFPKSLLVFAGWAA